MSNSRLLVDPIPNSQNKHHKNVIAESRANYKWNVVAKQLNYDHCDP